jgi:ubiquitin conjugation factor E4 B
VASDSFVVNLQAVLLEFAAPFLDANYSKIDKVDPDYYKNSTRIDISEETKIHATQEQATEYYRRDPDLPPCE